MNRKINFPWWFVIILLAAFAVGYWAWTESLNHESGIMNYGSSSASHETAGEISTWKTYRNEEYGFEFKYPADMISVTSKADLIILDKPETFELYQKKKLTRVGDLAVYLNLNSKDMSTNDFYGNQNTTFVNPENVTIGTGVPAYKVIDCGIGDKHTCVTVPAKGVFIEFTSFLGEPLFNQILSTFKFIE